MALTSSGVDRDYTAKTLKKISNEINDYFGNDGDAGWIDSKLYKYGVFKIYRDNVKGNYEKYVKSLGTKSDEVVKKIKGSLKKVEETEIKYNNRFNETISESSSCKNIMKNFSEAISFRTFSVIYDFTSIDKKNSNDYLNLIQSRANVIIEKESSQWSEEEIEIVSYAYMNSNDEKFKSKVLNSFYRKSTDEHYKNENKFSKNELNCDFYDRDKESWEKFLKCNDYYFLDTYNKYIKGEIDDETFDAILKNHMTGGYLSDERYAILVSKEKRPIKISSNGNLEAYASRYKLIEFKQDNIYADGEKNFAANDFDRISYKNEFEIKNISNGNDAESYINDKMQLASIKSEEFDYNDYARKLIEKGASKISDTILPGSGKVVDKIFDVVNTVVEDIPSNNPEMSTYDSINMSTYVSSFGFKLVHSSKGYVLYNTPESTSKVNEFINYLKENKSKYPEAYKLYAKNKTAESYVDGSINVNNLLDYIDESHLDTMLF